MSTFKVLSASEQVAEHLRNEIYQDTWKDIMPDRDFLAAHLGVGPATVLAALEQLEHEGLLIPQGVGKPRRIHDQKRQSRKKLRIGLFLYDEFSRTDHIVLSITHALREKGHHPVQSRKTFSVLGMNTGNVAKFMQSNDFDKIPPRVVQWANSAPRKKRDHHHALIEGKFIDGGTIGPAPKT